MRLRPIAAVLALLTTLLSGPLMAWPQLEPSVPITAIDGSPAAFSCQNLSASPLTGTVDWATQVFPKLETCASCHLSEFGGSRIRIIPGDPELTLIDLLDPADGLVVALKPAQSGAFRRVNCDRIGDQPWRMPRCFSPPCNYWSAADQALLFDWIAQGARGDFEGSPLSDVVLLNDFEGARIWPPAL